MPLHISHLKHRIDRLQLLNNQLFEQNIDYYRLWDGILDEENPKRRIAKAHKQIIEWADNQNLPSIIIAEDDIKFTAPGAFEYTPPVQACCLNPNKCKRPAYINHFTTSEKRHAIIRIRQRDADRGLGSSGTLEPTGDISKRVFTQWGNRYKWRIQQISCQLYIS